MFDLKKGTMKFLLNACLDTLPKKTNLLQWGKTTSDMCKLCLDANQDLQGRRKETTHNTLNGCKVSLNQQRYTYVNTWRHNNILKYICEMLTVKNVSSMQISTDTPYQAEGQFPPTSVLPLSDQISSSMTD